MSTEKQRQRLETIAETKFSIMKLAHDKLISNQGNYKRSSQYKLYQLTKKEYEEARKEFEKFNDIN